MSNLINGRAYDFGSIELKINGIIFVITKIDYKSTREAGESRGNSPWHRGKTRGQLKEEGSIGMPKDEMERLKAVLGDGFLEIPFTITVSYADIGMPVVVDTIRGCLGEMQGGGSKGTDALESESTLIVDYILWNGKRPMLGRNF